jgi:hypothetical protein
MNRKRIRSAQIPIPERREFLKNLETAAKPKGLSDNGSEEKPEVSMHPLTIGPPEACNAAVPRAVS